MSEFGTLIAEWAGVQISLEFLEVEDRTNSARILITLELESGRQQLRYVRYGSWVEYEALDKFVSDIRDGADAILTDMSNYPVIEIKGSGEKYALIINPHADRVSREAEEIRLEVGVEPRFLQILWEKFNDYPKWW